MLRCCDDLQDTLWVRLEQGRARTPSAQVCTALARALQLSDAEQAHLFRLAGHAHDTTRIPRMIPASVRRIVDRLDRHPVGVYDATWTLLSWNPLWAALFGDPSALDERARNTVWRHFTAGAMERVRQTPDEVRAFENSMVADLRATAGRHPDDPGLAALLAGGLDATARYGRPREARPARGAGNPDDQSSHLKITAWLRCGDGLQDALNG